MTRSKGICRNSDNYNDMTICMTFLKQKKKTSPTNSPKSSSIILCQAGIYLNNLPRVSANPGKAGDLVKVGDLPGNTKLGS